MPATLQVHARKLKLDPDVTNDVLRQVARDLPGLSGRSRRPPLSICCASMLTNSDCMPVQMDCTFCLPLAALFDAAGMRAA